MALKKEIIQDNGIKTSYFKINKVTIDTQRKNVVVNIKTYSDISYRNKEKEYEKNKNVYLKLQEELNNELSKENKNEDLIKKIADEINDYNFEIEKDYNVGEFDILYPFENETISLSILYEKLKKQSLFSESEDC